MSDICCELADGFYGLPRFELPEWLWERLPRTDPAAAMAQVESLGPALRLDEPTVSHEWIRFDAPGDFQLILREDFFAIDGLDEKMLLGYHVDSNLSRRMLFRRGSIQSLGDSVAGYHCNHNRERTVYHGARIVTNDLERFVVSLEQAELPGQRETWGLVDERVEELAVRERVGPRFASALAGTIPTLSGPRGPSDVARVPYELTYDSGHVLPFVADALAVSAPDAMIGYIGANPVLQKMLATAVKGFGFERPLESAGLDDIAAVEDLVERADVLVLDLGIDESAADPTFSSPGLHQPARMPPELFGVFDVLERVVEVERGRVERGQRPTRFVLVHSWTVFWDAFVLANFDCSHTTAHSRVRRARVSEVPVDDAAAKKALARERLLVHWATRRESGRVRLPVPKGGAVEVGRLRDFSGFRDGWAFPEEEGIWTQGSRAEVALALDGNGEGDHVLGLSLRSVCVAPDGSLKVAARVNGEQVATREFNWGDPEWHIEVPSSLSGDGELDLTLEIENPSTPLDMGWSLDDDRPLGLFVRAITVLSASDDAARAGLVRERRVLAWAARRESSDGRLRVRPREVLDLDELADYGGFRTGWRMYSEQQGIWTEGPRSELALALDGLDGRDYFLSLSLGSICVAPDEPLTVEAYINGEHVAARELQYGDSEWRIESPVPAPADGEIDLILSISEPRSPSELGWSADERPLGLLVRGLTLGELDRSVRLAEMVVFSEGSGADRLFGPGWSGLESTGVWTDGEKAVLVLQLMPVPPGDVELILDVDPFLSPAHPELGVEIFAKGKQLAARDFRHRRGALRLRLRHRPLRVVVPATVLDESGRVVLELRLRNPARPVDLGLSDDSRRLGLRLRSLTGRPR